MRGSWALLVVVALSCSPDGSRSPSDAGSDVPAPDAAGDSLPGLDAMPDSPAPGDAGGAGLDAEAGSARALLSETGLYADMASDMVAPDARPFAPNYALWSDGAEKRRWVHLPPGTVIDTTDPDHWVYPVGTRAWKEFSVDGAKVETRLLEKVGPAEWTMTAYVWRADGTDAVAVPDGVPDANGTTHDVPSSHDCHACHDNVPDVLLGVTALQLAGGAGLSLAGLSAEGVLEPPLASVPPLPGDENTRAALGYLHANCGHCHNPRSKLWATLDLELWLPLGGLETLEGTPTYLSTVGVEPSVPWGGATARIVPGSPSPSVLYQRMASRGRRDGTLSLDMPPLATEKTDPEGLSVVRTFIESLGAAHDE